MKRPPLLCSGLCCRSLPGRIVFGPDGPDCCRDRCECGGVCEQQAARVPMLDLAAASEVEQKIKDPAYRAYARQVIADDTTMQKTLQELARSVGVALPNGLDDERALVLRDLQASDGAQLEQKYRSSQIGGTRQAIEMIHNFERNAHDPKMKLWAETALPALQKHLEAAMRLPEIPSAPQG